MTLTDDDNLTYIAPMIMKEDLRKRHNQVEPKVNFITFQTTTRNLHKKNQFSYKSHLNRPKNTPDSSMFRNTR